MKGESSLVYGFNNEISELVHKPRTESLYRQGVEVVDGEIVDDYSDAQLTQQPEVRLLASQSEYEKSASPLDQARLRYAQFLVEYRQKRIDEIQKTSNSEAIDSELQRLQADYQKSLEAYFALQAEQNVHVLYQEEVIKFRSITEREQSSEHQKPGLGHRLVELSKKKRVRLALGAAGLVASVVGVPGAPLIPLAAKALGAVSTGSMGADVMERRFQNQLSQELTQYSQEGQVASSNTDVARIEALKSMGAEGEGRIDLRSISVEQLAGFIAQVQELKTKELESLKQDERKAKVLGAVVGAGAYIGISALLSSMSGAMAAEVQSTSGSTDAVSAYSVTNVSAEVSATPEGNPTFLQPGGTIWESIEQGLGKGVDATQVNEALNEYIKSNAGRQTLFELSDQTEVGRQLLEQWGIGDPSNMNQLDLEQLRQLADHVAPGELQGLDQVLQNFDVKAVSTIATDTMQDSVIESSTTPSMDTYALSHPDISLPAGSAPLTSIESYFYEAGFNTVSEADKYNVLQHYLFNNPQGAEWLYDAIMNNTDTSEQVLQAQEFFRQNDIGSAEQLKYYIGQNFKDSLGKPSLNKFFTLGWDKVLKPSNMIGIGRSVIATNH